MLLAAAKAKGKYVGGVVSPQATAILTSPTASSTSTYCTKVDYSWYQPLFINHMTEMYQSRLVAKIGSNRRYCRCPGGI